MRANVRAEYRLAFECRRKPRYCPFVSESAKCFDERSTQLRPVRAQTHVECVEQRRDGIDPVVRCEGLTCGDGDLLEIALEGVLESLL